MSNKEALKKLLKRIEKIKLNCNLEKDFNKINKLKMQQRSFNYESFRGIK